MLDDYKQAFLACYPHKTIEILPKKVRGEIRYRVFIDKDGGDTLLSGDDIKFATRMFRRGK